MKQVVYSLSHPRCAPGKQDASLSSEQQQHHQGFPQACEEWWTLSEAGQDGTWETSPARVWKCSGGKKNSHSPCPHTLVLGTVFLAPVVLLSPAVLLPLQLFLLRVFQVPLSLLCHLRADVLWASLLILCAPPANSSHSLGSNHSLDTVPFSQLTSQGFSPKLQTCQISHGYCTSIPNSNFEELHPQILFSFYIPFLSKYSSITHSLV